jgi:hypothetical protein
MLAILVSLHRLINDHMFVENIFFLFHEHILTAQSLILRQFMFNLGLP